MGILEKNITLRQLFLQKTIPWLLLILFLDWNKTNLEKNTTNRLPKSSEIWNFDCQLRPLTFFCISYFWKMEKQNRKMSVNEFSIQYCTLWKITYSNLLRKIAKKYSIYFLLYISLSLSKKSSHSNQDIWPVHVLIFKDII